ncbi:2-oxoglutarate and iron-dependent oxygenase domain-containing protein CP2 [Frankliniella fusca]|uniref:2-oxoglutarate and iron-dependent oxygenase domain-containing protein CP2 n=1 Tax=Frankliniella fusca TaxID=407009 RepID=A0AAE1LF40_9NEOP|nr:2-oxoglutarate and iron-dependent oxygenase domain-containing protein CP2 [Frankliniella fusca]
MIALLFKLAFGYEVRFVVSKMSTFREKLNKCRSANYAAYTKAFQLPVQVALPIKSIERYTKPNETEDKLRVFSEPSPGLLIQVFLGKKFDSLTKEDCEAMNLEIKDNVAKWFLVSRGGIALDKIVLDMIDDDTRKTSSIPVFDTSLHKIKQVDKDGKLRKYFQLY